MYLLAHSVVSFSSETPTCIHSDHACLQVLQETPHAVDVLRESITSQPHISIIGQLDRLVLGLESIQRSNGRKRFLLRDEHLFRHSRENSWLKEVPRLSHRFSTQDDVCAETACIFNLGSGLVDATGRG